MNKTEIRDRLITKATEIITNKSAHAMNEGVEMIPIIGIAGLFAFYFALWFKNNRRTEDEYEMGAKSAIAVDPKEYADAIVHCKEFARDYNISTSAVKNYAKAGAINLTISAFDDVMIDPSKRSFVGDGHPFTVTCSVADIDMTQLAISTGKANSVMMTADRLNKYVSDQTEFIAKWYDDFFNQMCASNDFLKKAFYPEIQVDKNDLYAHCTIKSNALVLSTSKYLKG